ncbi:hypothetical protein VA596_09655 [Amycolatopsis sp., V23-08]|uniref:Excreted virulence factor EspC, type VII ESX diderm n=1 Tax=Amycolatopsis heterodermiae TaxID=3110235 RepID=A0ABU5R0S4_9PSEU|nr:hypothetical protein [Amycolatopsis sp., V23-08]MEA5359802.1 hypothetical protein [Amycolatopsis sp., V23-08]
MAGQTGPGFDENPDAIDAHAKQIEATFGVLKEASELSKNDPIDSGAFGLIGQLCFLDQWCANVAGQARETLESAVKGAEYHVQAVQTWAKARRVDEASASALVNRASEVRGG